MVSHRIQYRSNNNIVYSCTYHVVWCPKYRKWVLVNGVDERLKEMIVEKARQWNCDVLEVEIMPDHVHLLVEVDPQFGVHRLIKTLKDHTSKRLRQEFPWLRSCMPTWWTNSSFVSTVGGAPLAIVKPYIAHQKLVA